MHPAIRKRYEPVRIANKPKRAALWGLALGGFIGLVCFAPASWLAFAVQHGSQDHVLFLQPSGSVWQGSAQLALSAGDQSAEHQILQGRLHWKIRPTWLGFNTTWQADCCIAQPWLVKLRLAWKEMQLSADALQSTWPALWLQGIGAPFNTLQLGGTLLVSSPTGFQLHWTPTHVKVTGQIQLDLENVSSALSTLRPLGHYRMLFSTPSTAPDNNSGFQVQLNLQTLQGPLQLIGTGAWRGQPMNTGQSPQTKQGKPSNPINWRTHFQFQGEAASDEAHVQALANLLNIIGQREGQRSLLRFSN